MRYPFRFWKKALEELKVRGERSGVLGFFGWWSWYTHRNEATHKGIGYGTRIMHWGFGCWIERVLAIMIPTSITCEKSVITGYCEKLYFGICATCWGRSSGTCRIRLSVVGHYFQGPVWRDISGRGLLLVAAVDDSGSFSTANLYLALPHPFLSFSLKCYFFDTTASE